jgi:hypothetical protein
MPISVDQYNRDMEEETDEFDYELGDEEELNFDNEDRAVELFEDEY